MIEIVVQDNTLEARRLREALESHGTASRLVLADQQDWQCGTGTKLVDVSVFAGQPQSRLNPNMTVVAFGGEDKAASAGFFFKQGAVDYLPRGIAGEHLLHALETLKGSRPTQASPPPGPDMLADQDVSTGSESRAMKAAFQLALRVAQTPIAILVSGASGSGKEVLARYIHQASDRRDGAYVAINCAAIPETMLEAMLFGHAKGAFTGASESRSGKFELADGGTLLLDEITEMPIALQAKLLRVLQEKEVERIGSNRPRRVNVRVIATTNRDPLQAVHEGTLREDLYYRLSVFPIRVPSLRERNEDILPLAAHFLRHYGANREVELAAASKDLLLRHSWPGNVRELENCIQRALVLADNNIIEPSHLNLAEVSATTLAGNDKDLSSKIRRAEEEHLLDSLAANNGKRNLTAAELGISERTLRYKLKQLRDRGVDLNRL